MKYRTEGDVRRVQEARREAQELLPAHDWTEKRKALIESGLVAERAAEIAQATKAVRT